MSEKEDQPEAQDAMERHEENRKAMGDERVPSDPEHYRPANIPPEPLTKTESSEEGDNA